jgi:pyrimidine and pyridine-specific 5'-nucleotidase
VNVLRDSSLGSSMRRMRVSGEGNVEAHEGLCVCGGKKKKKRGYWSGYRDDSDDSGEEGSYVEKGALVKALKGDGKGRFNEIEVRRVVRALGREERMRL